MALMQANTPTATEIVNPPWRAQGTWDVCVVHGPRATSHSHTVTGRFRARRVLDGGERRYRWHLDLDQERFLSEEDALPCGEKPRGGDYRTQGGPKTRKVRKSEHRDLMEGLKSRLEEKYGPLNTMGAVFHHNPSSSERRSWRDRGLFGFWPALGRLPVPGATR